MLILNGLPTILNRFKFLLNGCGKCLKALIIHVSKWVFLLNCKVLLYEILCQVTIIPQVIENSRVHECTKGGQEGSNESCQNYILH